MTAIARRLLDLFEGPAGLEPWSPPETGAALCELLPWRAFDERGELYVNAGSVGFAIEIPPFAGIDAETLGALAGTLADAAPERCTVQVIHWASPRFGAALDAWAGPRAHAGPVQAGMARRRLRLLERAGWRALHPGGPPFTLADYRAFVCASLAGPPGPAPETALSAFRRALEGTLASAGAATRRLGPDALLSLASELTAPAITPDEEAGTPTHLHRPNRRWSPRDPLHLQCAAPGRALTVAPTGLVFHDGGTPRSAKGGDTRAGDVAVRVLTAATFPEVWPGWRGNALIGDFHRDFLQPGCPVLTCLTVMTGEAADGEKAFLKSARATQQAGTGIARYLPGLPEKARDWQFVTERIKDGERLVRACYMAAVYAPLDSLDEAEQAVRAIYHGQGWRVSAERYVQLPSWLSCLPMVPAGGLDADLARMGRMKTLLTSSVVNLAPVHGEWRGQSNVLPVGNVPGGGGSSNADNPPALFLIGRRGQPAGWSPFANEAGNYNVAVTGKSGSGKSVLMQELVTGIVGAGGEAVVIDDGRSFQHTAEALEGAFIAFGKDPACLNPFAMIDAGTANRDGDYREECFAMLAGVIGRMCRRRGSIDDIEAALIAEAIASAWDEKGNEADLGTVRNNLDARDDRRAKDMATALGPWCPGGAMGRLFAGAETPALDAALTVFELAELKGRGDVQAVVLMLVVFLATQRMYHGERTRAKAIVIDEAWDLLSGEDSKAFLEGAARRARKYRGSLITGTQSVNDYYANPAARAAWENSDWTIFLAQKDESVELLKQEKRIHCDPGMERALQEPDHGRGPLCRAAAARPGRLAGGAPRARCLVGGAVLLARPRLRGGGKAQGRRALHRRGHRPARRGRSPRGRRADRRRGPPRRCRSRHRPCGRQGSGRMNARTVEDRREAAAAEDADGRLAWPGDPEGIAAVDIDFEALAYVLANTCRFGGRTRQYHSLAAHAVVASEEVEALDGLGAGERRSLALHALIADAPSAWLRGEPSSSQRTAKLAASIEAAVREAAGLDPVLDEDSAELLRFVFRMTAAAERRDLADADAGPGAAFPPLRRRIRAVGPGRAARLWLARFRALSGPPRSGDAQAGQPDGEENGNGAGMQAERDAEESSDGAARQAA